MLWKIHKMKRLRMTQNLALPNNERLKHLSADLVDVETKGRFLKSRNFITCSNRLGFPE